MWIIGWLLTKMLLLRFIMIVSGIALFVLLLEIVIDAESIMKIASNSFVAIGKYSMLRAPSIIAIFMDIAILLAALWVVIELTHNSEMVAIWSAGTSQFKLMLSWLPPALLLGLGHFFLTNNIIPITTPQLYKLDIGEYRKKANNDDNQVIWMRSGNDILRAKSSNAAATQLNNVIIFRRDNKGSLLEQISAKKAILQQDNRWRLDDLEIYYQDNIKSLKLKHMVYSALLRPATSDVRSGNPEEMSLLELSKFIDNSGYGIRPVRIYKAWWHKRFAQIITAILMVIVALTLSSRFSRGGKLGQIFLVGIGIGFAFFIFDGITMTMGEFGILPPWLAAWLPIISFGSVIGAVSLKQEAFG